MKSCTVTKVQKFSNFNIPICHAERSEASLTNVSFSNKLRDPSLTLRMTKKCVSDV